MKHEENGLEMFDFVFATANSGDPDHRRHLQEFFESYKARPGRNGEYLTSADISNPLWEARYQSPQELCRSHPSAQSHLKFLERRIQEAQLGKETQLHVLRALCSLPDVEYIRRISRQIDMNPALWISTSSLSDNAVQFLARVDMATQMPALIETLAVECPSARRRP
jgi:hypothetical protein